MPNLAKSGAAELKEESGVADGKYVTTNPGMTPCPRLSMRFAAAGIPDCIRSLAARSSSADQNVAVLSKAYILDRIIVPSAIWIAIMSDKGIRIAVVELNPRHDELFPTWLRLAKISGYRIDFFISPLHESRDIFSVLESPGPKCFLTSSPELGDAMYQKILKRFCTIYLRARALLLLKTKYDLVIANSVERENNYWMLFRYLNKPMLAVMHNSNLLVGNKQFDHLAKERSTSIVVLSKHIQSFLAQHEVSSYRIYPIAAPGNASFSDSDKDEHTFCVQGNIDFHRRNYDSLLNAACQLKENGIRCNFRIVGGLNRSAGILQEKIEQLGVSDYFTFKSDTESYRDYYKAIGGCRFMLILIDDSRMIYRPFFEDKCTSSLNVALGLDVIPVVNQRFAEVYGISGFSVLYESDDVYSGIRSALSNEREQIRSLTNNLKLAKQQYEDDSELEFGKAVTEAIRR